MIFWCHDQDLFCATWYDIWEAEKTRTCFVLHGMKLVVREKPEL